MIFYIAVPRYGHNENSAVISVENYNETKVDDSTDETLIELVFERPALWNHKLPLQDRTNLKKDALWLEVSNRMGGGNLGYNYFIYLRIYISYLSLQK